MFSQNNLAVILVLNIWNAVETLHTFFFFLMLWELELTSIQSAQKLEWHVKYTKHVFLKKYIHLTLINLSLIKTQLLYVKKYYTAIFSILTLPQNTKKNSIVVHK